MLLVEEDDNNVQTNTHSNDNNTSEDVLEVNLDKKQQQPSSSKIAHSTQSLTSASSKINDHNARLCCCCRHKLTRILFKTKRLLCCQRKSTQAKVKEKGKVHKTICKSDIVHLNLFEERSATRLEETKEISSVTKAAESEPSSAWYCNRADSSRVLTYTYSDLINHPETLRIQDPTRPVQQYTQADICSLPPIIADAKMMADYIENSSNRTARLPSYMSLSRAISGYAEYNKYCPELKRDPPKPSYGFKASQLYTNTKLPSDQVDNFYSLPTNINDKLLVSNEEDSSKSLIQKKIESLYGESFAEDWLKSKPKVKLARSNRSPSCPPNRIEKAQKDSKTGSVSVWKTHQISLDESRRSKTPEAGRANDENANTFLEKLGEETTQIRHKITKWEAIFNDSDENIPEEVIGYGRSSIGKANLLLDKKCKQFSELCHDSLRQTGDEEFKIKFNDLRGFWEMMLIQVEEVHKAFGRLETVKANGWQGLEQDLVPHGTPKPVKKNDHSESPSRKSSKGETASPSLNDLERRTRLMQIKKQGKLKQAQAAESNENINDSNNITIFVSTTTTTVESNSTEMLEQDYDDNISQDNNNH